MTPAAPKPKPANQAARERAEFARVYGSKERVAWVKAQPCVGCGARPSDNHHTKNGGFGRKGDYTTIVPLCRGCHRALHNGRKPCLDWGDGSHLAAATEARWQREQAPTLF